MPVVSYDGTIFLQRTRRRSTGPPTTGLDQNVERIESGAGTRSAGHWASVAGAVVMVHPCCVTQYSLLIFDSPQPAFVTRIPSDVSQPRFLCTHGPFPPVEVSPIPKRGRTFLLFYSPAHSLLSSVYHPSFSWLAR